MQHPSEVHVQTFQQLLHYLILTVEEYCRRRVSATQREVFKSLPAQLG